MGRQYCSIISGTDLQIRAVQVMHVNGMLGERTFRSGTRGIGALIGANCDYGYKLHEGTHDQVREKS